MERPRLRANLDLFIVHESGEPLLALRDPERIAPGIATLPPVAAAIAQLLDGSSTRDEICQQFKSLHGRDLATASVEKLVSQLDDALLLDSPRFSAARQEIYADYARRDERPAFHAGETYPQDPSELRAYLDAQFTAKNGPGAPAPKSRALPSALVVPHIDYARGGPAYAWAYRALTDANALPELIVLFGTDHQGSTEPFTFTHKHYATPLGPLTTDRALVDVFVELARKAHGDDAAKTLTHAELIHRAEHSLELQMVWLRHCLDLIDPTAHERVRVLPILCGTLHEHVETSSRPEASDLRNTVTAQLADLTKTRKTLFIAGADLAHVGPRFGDVHPLTHADCGSLEARDHETLAAVLRGSSDAWFDEISRESDARRVCGLAPIYALLSTARPQTPGKLLAYAQCPADEQAGSVVSIASIAFD